MFATTTLSATYVVEISDLTGNEPLHSTSTRVFEPTRVRLQWRWSENRPDPIYADTVVVSGPRILKDGPDGEPRRGADLNRRYYSFEQKPEWLEQLIRDHAPDWSALIHM